MERRKNFKGYLLLLLVSCLVAILTAIPLGGMPDPQISALTSAGAGDMQAPAAELMPPRPGLLDLRTTRDRNSIIPLPGLKIPFRENTVPAERSSVATTGTAIVLAVLVEFPDKPFGNPPLGFNDLFAYWNYRLFDHNNSESLHSYYQEVSYGQLEITGKVAPYIVRASNSMSYYGADGSGVDNANGRKISELAREAMRKLDDNLPSFDFSIYDLNRDGKIDHLIIIHAGSGQEFTGNSDDIWSHRWAIDGGEPLTNPAGTIPPVTYASGYTMQPEDGRLGVFAHEFAHDLGLPDLYDTEGDSMGLGDWSLMGSGSWNGGNTLNTVGTKPAHLSAWEKIQLGWITPETITSTGSITIPTVSGTGIIEPRVYRLPVKDSISEYFLLENRQQVGFDAGLPGSGLLIYHIDESVQSNDNQSHYKVALEQADNLKHLERNMNAGDTGDPYPGATGNRIFSGTSQPDSKSYRGEPASFAVSEISNSSSIMTAEIKPDLSVTPSGGTVESNGVKVEFPKGAVTRSIFVKITPVDQAKAAPASGNSELTPIPGEPAWNIEPDGLRFYKPVKLTLPYPDLTDPDIAGKLRIFYWDPREVSWMPVGGKVDKANKTVTAEINHFSMYTVMESSSPVSTSGNLISYLALTNNPFSPNGDGKKDNTIFKFNLARDARVNIRIHDSYGNLVLPLVEGINQTAGPGSIVWDGTNNAGQTVGSGIYIFKIEATDGQGQTQTMTRPVAVVVPR